jgi:hypothetical protein
VPGAMQSTRGGMSEDGERQGLTVAALCERRIIFVDVCDGHRPPMQERNDHSRARSRNNGWPAD